MATKVPAFTTTCAYTSEVSGGYWYIYLKSSGTIKFSYAKRAADVFACGGGGGVINEGDYGRPGGAGGGGKGADGGNYGGGGADAVAGTANTGGGGGGYGSDLNWDDNFEAGGNNADGGSGIVILRGTQDDLLPVKFNGVQIAKMTFNGENVTGLIYDGTRIFAEALRRMRQMLAGRMSAYGV